MSDEQQLARALVRGSEVVYELGRDWSVRLLADVADDLGWTVQQVEARLGWFDATQEAIGLECRFVGTLHERCDATDHRTCGGRWHTYARLNCELLELIA